MIYVNRTDYEYFEMCENVIIHFFVEYWVLKELTYFYFEIYLKKLYYLFIIFYSNNIKL
jgi:hypothetical protein